MIDIKTAAEIALMKQGGRILGRIRDQLASAVKPGMTTKQLDTLAFKLIKKAGGQPSFLNFDGYPASTCISINDEIVHGIPGERLIENGDIVGIDVGILFQGFHTDTAVTVPVGEISPDKKRLLKITHAALDAGINTVKPGIHLGDVQFAIQTVIDRAGLGIVRDLTGHGIGRQLQESPVIPNFGKPGTGPILKPGMALALEPIVTLGDYHIAILEDGWTIISADGSPSAHFEHTVIVTKNGATILTQA